MEFLTHKLSAELKTVELLSYEEMGRAFIATFITVHCKNQDSIFAILAVLSFCLFIDQYN